MQNRIAITPRSLSARGHPQLQRLAAAGFELVYPAPGKQPSESELLSSLPGCVGMLAGVEPISTRVLDASPGLRVISRNGVGVDNIDVEYAKRRGIAVCRASGANSRGVAELAVGLMFAGLRHISWSDRQLRLGDWLRRTGLEVEDRTLGVIGCGAIGQTVSRLALGLGMRVLAFDPLSDRSFNAGPGFAFASLKDVLSESDVITLHCPPSSTPLLDSEKLRTVKRGLVLINTARAELVDDGALLEALVHGSVGCYATDVYRAEPPAITPLLSHQNTILMPHAGGLTEESVERATRIAVDNLLEALS